MKFVLILLEPSIPKVKKVGKRKKGNFLFIQHQRYSKTSAGRFAYIVSSPTVTLVIVVE